MYQVMMLGMGWKSNLGANKLPHDTMYYDVSEDDIEKHRRARMDVHQQHSKDFIAPLQNGHFINISGYATNMASWLIEFSSLNMHPLNISLLIGMVPYDGLSVPIHEGYGTPWQTYPKAVDSFSCSYV